MYPTNAYYGNSIVLAAYSELEQPLFPPTIPGYVQPWLDAEVPARHSAARLPAFVWGSAARLRRHRQGLRNHLPIGAPWLYLLELEKRDAIPQPPLREDLRAPEPEAGRTLYFPHHGMAGDDAAAANARALTSVTSHGPVTVALTREQASSEPTRGAYEDAGANVVDLGLAVEEVGSVAPFYLERVLRLMRVHQNVRADQPNAFALFANAAGMKVEVPGLTESELARLTRTQLGTDCVVPPPELRALFDWRSHD